MKRTFIAIEIPLSNQTVDFINNIKSDLKDEKIRWVASNNMHITLFFLGDTNENEIGSICTKLSGALKDIDSFELICKGLGIFRSVYNPKALWLGFDKSGMLNSLKVEIGKVISDFGFTIEERKFKPHLTLGRMKYIKDRNNLKLLLEKYKDTYIQKFQISEIIFYESQLTTVGPIYKIIQKFSLG